MDDFDLRCVVRYLNGKGYPPNCNTGMKNRISKFASWHSVMNGTIYRDAGFQVEVGMSIIAVTAFSAVVSWAVNLYLDIAKDCTVELFVTEVATDRLVMERQVKYDIGCSCILHLEPGQEYLVRLRFVKYIKLDQTYEYILAEASQPYRAKLGKVELSQLLAKAEDMVSGDRGQYIRVLYRNKPECYYSEIFKNDGVMYPYMKDFNGDLGCPINGEIMGLFFGGKTFNNGSLPPSSPFGDTRFIIPVERLFHLGMNMYFADFYCHTVNHYVTVVLTEPFSYADMFCREHLLSLSMTHNPFFTATFNNTGDGFVYWMAKKVYVEVFYTLPVNLLWEMDNDYRCQMGKTSIIGRGYSKVEGIVKNPNCNICNLYKTKRRREESPVVTGADVKKPSTQSGANSVRPTVVAKRKNQITSESSKTVFPLATQVVNEKSDASQSKTQAAVITNKKNQTIGQSPANNKALPTAVKPKKRKRKSKSQRKANNSNPQRTVQVAVTSVKPVLKGMKAETSKSPMAENKPNASQSKTSATKILSDEPTLQSSKRVFVSPNDAGNKSIDDDIQILPSPVTTRIVIDLTGDNDVIGHASTSQVENGKGMDSNGNTIHMIKTGKLDPNLEPPSKRLRLDG